MLSACAIALLYARVSSMNNTPDLKPSTLPASALGFLIFFMLSWVIRLTVMPYGIFVWLQFAVIIIWLAKLLFDLARWLRADKEARPRMKFPKKTALALLCVVLLVGYMVYLIMRDIQEFL